MNDPLIYAIAFILGLNLGVWLLLVRSNDEYVGGQPHEGSIGQPTQWKDLP